jgi:hypothetical protein
MNDYSFGKIPCCKVIAEDGRDYKVVSSNLEEERSMLDSAGKASIQKLRRPPVGTIERHFPTVPNYVRVSRYGGERASLVKTDLIPIDVIISRP